MTATPENCPKCSREYEFGEALFVSYKCGTGWVLGDESTLKQTNACQLLAEARGEIERWKSQHDMVLRQARADNDRAHMADQYELWLTDLGRISGCGHIDDNLPRCIEQAFESVSNDLAEARERERRLREAERVPITDAWLESLGGIAGKSKAGSVYFDFKLDEYSDEGSQWVTFVRVHPNHLPGDGVVDYCMVDVFHAQEFGKWNSHGIGLTKRPCETRGDLSALFVGLGILPAALSPRVEPDASR
jgi:hypothetical protein